jgi:hypothetical protein
MEEGVSMTSGVDTTVMDTTSEITSTPMTGNTSFAGEEQAGPVGTESVVSAGISPADQLLETAKNDGFTASFEQLAMGSFTEPEVTPEVSEDIKEPSIEEILELNSEENLPAEQIPLDEIETGMLSPEDVQLLMEPLNIQVETLHKIVVDLESRLAKNEKILQSSIQSSLELALIIKKLIEEEEARKDKDLFTSVIRIIGELIKLMFIPEEMRDIAKSPEEKGKIIQFSPASRIEKQAA